MKVRGEATNHWMKPDGSLSPQVYTSAPAASASHDRSFDLPAITPSAGWPRRCADVQFPIMSRGRFLILRVLVLVSRTGRIVLRHPGVSGLNHEVPTVPVQLSAVDHVLTVGVEAVPLAIESILVVANEKVIVAHTKETTVYALAILEAGVDCVQQFPLSILLAEDVLMGPGVPVRDCLPPWGVGNEFREFHSWSNSSRGPMSTRMIA